MNLKDTPMVPRAKCAAVLAHESVGQIRKYGVAHYGKERYYFHPCRVAELVATVTKDETIIAAAALHDVLEDVSVKSEQYTPTWLLNTFGTRTLFYVVECTNVYTKDENQQRVLLEAVQLLDRELFCMGSKLISAKEGFKIAATANREQRKHLEATRYGTISRGAQIIKRADLYDNALSMDSAPADFVTRWMAEKAVAESLIGSWEEYSKRAGELAAASA